MNVNRWQRTGYGVGGLAALAVLFLGVVMLSNGLLRGVRLDLTQNRLYTLTPGTKAVLAELKEPVNLYYYFSRDAAAKQSPLLMPYATRVREFLEEIAARSGGKVHLRVVDPQPFSEDEDRRRIRPAVVAGRRRRCPVLRTGRNQLHGRPLGDPEFSIRARGIPRI